MQVGQAGGGAPRGCGTPAEAQQSGAVAGQVGHGGFAVVHLHRNCDTRGDGGAAVEVVWVGVQVDAALDAVEEGGGHDAETEGGRTVGHAAHVAAQAAGVVAEY